MKNENKRVRKKMYSKVLANEKGNPIFFSSMDSYYNTLNIALLEPKVKKLKWVDDYKTIESKLRLEHMNVTYKIDLHRKIGEAIIELLQSIIYMGKL